MKKHIHFIGIAGSLIAPLAVEFKKQGWRVTGSDTAFYPPMSTFLNQHKIKIIPGFNPEKFNQLSLPDLAVLMSFLTPKNPEVRYLKKRKVEIIGLGQLLERYFIKKKSIVVAGNYAKTTITYLLGWILETAGLDPTVLAGGFSYNFKSGVKIGETNWSVSEGDEFKVWHISRDYKFTRRPRLLYQKPKYAILTDATWDHYDLFATQEKYLQNYIKFLKLVPNNGFVLGNADGKNVRRALAAAKPTRYIVEINSGKSVKLAKNTFKPINIKYKKTGLSFELFDTAFNAPLYGAINVLNTALAVSTAYLLGIDIKHIKKALETFKGIKRRQEIRYSSPYYDKRGLGGVKIIDDFAHSPVKLQGIISALRDHYLKDKIILVYQPGSKTKQALSEYKQTTFAGVDQIILPRVSSAKQFGREFNSLLAHKLKGYPNLKPRVKYIDDDKKVVEHLARKIKQLKKNHKVIVLFAGQKGFRGMIEELIPSL